MTPNGFRDRHGFMLSPCKSVQPDFQCAPICARFWATRGPAACRREQTLVRHPAPQSRCAGWKLWRQETLPTSSLLPMAGTRGRVQPPRFTELSNLQSRMADRVRHREG